MDRKFLGEEGTQPVVWRLWTPEPTGEGGKKKIRNQKRKNEAERGGQSRGREGDGWTTDGRLVTGPSTVVPYLKAEVPFNLHYLAACLGG